MHHVTKHLAKPAVTTATNAVLGTMYVPDDITHHVRVSKNTAYMVHHRARTLGSGWRQLSWTDSHKYSRPLIGSAAWVNLVFGEAIATGLQGGVQALGGSNAASISASLITAFVVEVGFAIPIAVRNRHGNEPISTRQIARAMGTAFWLGGAWGVEQEKLRPKHILLPVSSYMLFALVLALVGEYNNLALRLIESPAFYAALIAAGIIVKVNDIVEHEGLFERMGKRTAVLVDTTVSKRSRTTKKRARQSPVIRHKRA